MIQEPLAAHHAATHAAMSLASRGLHVFPCREDNKAPCTRRGFHDAVSGSMPAQALFRRFPGALIGVPTGPLNGFDALDIDPRHDGDTWLKLNQHRLPWTRAHRTRSGGWHFLFRSNPGVRNSTSAIAPGVDVRGDGGYIIWWPATGCEVQRAPLAPWPVHLLDVLLPKPPPPPASRPAAPPCTSTTQARRLLQRCLARVESAPAGQRHSTLRGAAYTIGGILGGDLGETEAGRLLLEAVQRAGGADVDANNATKTIASGLAKGALHPLEWNR